VCVSLATGRYWIGKERGKSDGDGDVIELIMHFRRLNFYGAVKELTRWLIRHRQEKDRYRRSLCVPALPVVELKAGLWTVFEKKNLIAGNRRRFYRRERLSILPGA
jgi:hypothetical protein